MSAEEPRCYRCDTAPARYLATLDYDFTPDFKLCVDCAAFERDWGSVIEIRSIA